MIEKEAYEKAFAKGYIDAGMDLMKDLSHAQRAVQINMAMQLLGLKPQDEE